ncbi:MAG: respiratory nitrate reductase subunit gamma [Candidatus Nanopelagicales bacterium]
MNVVLWGVLPYIMLVVLIGGTIWRYRYDQFGWTTRSSQLYESRLLRIGSPLFHFGLLFVIVGHLVGLVIPQNWTEKIGMSETLYHVNALVVGGIAGVCTLLGIGILIYRRRTTGPVFMATTKNDKMMYVVLVGAIVLGVATTVVSASAGLSSHEYNYRDTVAPWFRSLFVLQPDVASMAAAPVAFKIHTLVGMLLFTIWPFTRLVHAFTAPFHYLFRPYVVYRSRDARPAPGVSAPKRGWDPVGTRDRDR